MRFLNLRGWLVAAALALLLAAWAVRAVSATPTAPPSLDHPWSRLP
jgi:hypothetical protein